MSSYGLVPPTYEDKKEKKTSECKLVTARYKVRFYPLFVYKVYAPVACIIKLFIQFQAKMFLADLHNFSPAPSDTHLSYKQLLFYQFWIVGDFGILIKKNSIKNLTFYDIFLTVTQL